MVEAKLKHPGTGRLAWENWGEAGAGGISSPNDLDGGKRKGSELWKRQRTAVREARPRLTSLKWLGRNRDSLQ